MTTSMDLVFRASEATRRGSQSKLRLATGAQEIKESAVDAAHDGAETAAVLIHWVDLPTWQQEGNQLIETGYRNTCETLWKCFESWGYLHNETVNIYSHLVGAAIFASLPFHVFFSPSSSRQPIASTADIFVCSIYFLAVSICFLLSALFHTVMIQSPQVFQAGIKLDFLGVILLMWGATVPLVYYGLSCDTTLQKVYWTLLTVLGAGCSVFVLQPSFRNPYLRHFRAITFGVFGASNILPIFHSALRYGWSAQERRMGLFWMLGTIIFDFFGAVAYSTKWPEKSYRRRFDLFGASHQILHICVLLAAITHALGMLSAFDHSHSHANICPAHSDLI